MTDYERRLMKENIALKSKLNKLDKRKDFFFWGVVVGISIHRLYTGI